MRLELAATSGTTAIAAGGSAASSSAFARATPSTEPTSSRWTGPIAVIDADVRPRDRGRARRSGRSRACPSRRCRSPCRARAGRASAARRARRCSSPRPRPCARRGAQSAARMSFVDVLPVEPVIADDARRAALAHRAADRGERGERVARDERRRAAPARARRRGTPRPPPTATKRSPGPTRARVDLRRRSRSPAPVELARRERRASSSSSGITRRGSRAQRLAGDVAVVERQLLARDLLALLVALAGDHDDVARLGELDGAPRSRCAGRDRSRRPCRRPGGSPR